MASADFTYGYNIPTDEQVKPIQAQLAAFMEQYRKTPEYRPAGWRSDPKLVKKYEEQKK